LLGTAVVAAGSAKPVEFKLEPWATLTGRLLDAEGKPVARASVYAPSGKGADGRTVDTVRIATFYTNAEGRFRIDGLLPGVAYDLSFRERQPKGRGGPVVKAVSLKPGETQDLGDRRVQQPEP
jgi:Carboxypeptidase regulatory-like domain